MSYPLLRIGLTRAQDSFTLKVSPRPTTGADTAPPFFYPIHAISYCTAILFRGAITNYQTNVMRRRFTAIRHHTDCTCRSIFGRRNRYVPSVQMILDRNAVHEDRTLGYGGAFRFLYPIPTTHLPYGRRAIELFISLFDKKRHFYPSALRPFFIAF